MTKEFRTASSRAGSPVPKVSVSLITYCQAATIRQAVESVLNQRVDFPMEIIIGDDASTDGTQDILRRLDVEHPGRLQLILAVKNGGDRGASNMATTLRAARGEYVAFLDGDDFWTDPTKLQRQVEALDSFADCNVCAHRVIHLYDDGREVLSPGRGPGISFHTAGDLILANFAPKISSVVRRSAITDLPPWFWTSDVISSDWVLNVLSTGTGRIALIDTVMAVHRMHAASVMATHGTDGMLAGKLKMLDLIDAQLPRTSVQCRRLRRRLTLKRRLMSFSPTIYAGLKRFNDVARTGP